MEEKTITPIQLGPEYDLLTKELEAAHLGKYKFEKQYTFAFYSIFLKNMARYLAKNKSKEQRVAIVINDSHNNFIMGVAIDYEPPENEEDEMPGNWEIVASFDSDKILGQPNEIVHNLQDMMFLNDLRNLIYHHRSIQVADAQALRIMLIMFFSSLLSAVQAGAKNEGNQPYSIKLEDMIVTGQVEDGKVVTSIELQGNIKAIAKDDTSLEDIIA